MDSAELLKRFIGVGYFPKELPPPFISASFSNNLVFRL